MWITHLLKKVDFVTEINKKGTNTFTDNVSAPAQRSMERSSFFFATDILAKLCTMAKWTQLKPNTKTFWLFAHCEGWRRVGKGIASYTVGNQERARWEGADGSVSLSWLKWFEEVWNPTRIHYNHNAVPYNAWGRAQKCEQHKIIAWRRDAIFSRAL